MDIQALHMQNNAYRDIIKGLKDQINRYDRLISANETEIGKQLTDMNTHPGMFSTCETCGSEDCNLES